MPRPPTYSNWLVAAVTVAPAAGAAICWATRHRGLAPGVVLAVAAGIVLAGGVVSQYGLLVRGLLPDQVPLHPVQAIVDLGVAAVAVVAMPKDRATRAWAVALLLPAAGLSTRLWELALSIAGG